MKKGAIRYNWIHYRKLIVTWIVLILILSFISQSAGSGNENDKVGPRNYTHSHENAGKDSESKTATNEDLQSEENTVEDLDSKEEDSIEEDSIEEDSIEEDSKEDIGNCRDNQEVAPENQEKITKELSSTDNQKNHKEIRKTTSDSEEDTNSCKNTEEELETKTGVEKGTDDEESLEKSTETKTETEQDKSNQENLEKNPEAGKVENYSKDNPENACKTQSQKEETEENPESRENSEANLKQKTSENNEIDSSNNPDSETEIETGSFNGPKNVETVEIETGSEKEKYNGITNSKRGELEPEAKIETGDGEKDLENNDMETKQKTEETSWSKISETKELKSEIKTEKNSWNNLKFILSYPSTLRSFYTTHESVKIAYKGSEALKDQKVDIYLVKTSGSSLSEEAVKNITDGNTISFEDIFSKNPEFYTQIPETLNEAGDMSPITLGPLSEGSYWVVVTLAENETKTSEPEKTILLEHYFKVMESEMEAGVSKTLEEGKNLEVNLRIENTPSQKKYTYCAVLLREDACRTNMNISSDTSCTKSMSGTFLQGLRLMEDFGFNSTDYGSETGKDKLKEEIQNLIGEGKGTVCIGKENQNTLSLTTSDLPPGNYLLLSGVYEKGKGLTGIAQTEVSIREDKKLIRSDTKQKSDTDLSTACQSLSTLKTESVLDAAGSLGLEGLKPQIRKEAYQAAEAVKKPSKMASFFIGLVGSLLIGIITVRGRMR